MDGSTGKRKQEDAAFQARVETGSLRVKISRKDSTPAPAKPSGSSENSEDEYSPPRPRPNRKHLPVFYQKSTRRRSNSDKNSTSSSDSGRFSSLMQELQIPNSSTSASSDVNASGDKDAGAPPTSNPLFTRNDSDGLAPFSDLFPSATSSAPTLPASSPTLERQSSSTASDRFDPMAALQTAIATHNALQQNLQLSKRPSSSSAPPPPSLSKNLSTGSSVSEEGDLGPPPSQPPKFANMNSLAGGGIDMPPVVSNVNVRTFDWTKMSAEEKAQDRSSLNRT